ncbi:MAG: hypothetical protein HN348_19170 [Proteobacteria bacterium]|nr:hypothetical protein [Pseudomonadota bacterium]
MMTFSLANASPPLDVLYRTISEHHYGLYKMVSIQEGFNGIVELRTQYLVALAPLANTRLRRWVSVRLLQVMGICLTITLVGVLLSWVL